MDRREALELIIAKSPDDRLRAARALNQVCEAEDIPKLETALSTETNKWVKGALSKALQSMRSPGVPLSIRAGAETEEERQSREIYANAIEETTSRLVHEIRPILGRLDVAAAAEIPNYDRSETKAEWNRLEELLNAIDAMRHAASAPVYKEFDLAGLLQRVITSETGGCPVTVQSAGTRPFIVLGSSSFIQIIVANAIRNAIEAYANRENSEPIVVAWDANDREYWIAVLDRGEGLPPALGDPFAMGSTSKKNHFGMGLANAKQAALSLSGKIFLSTREQGGVRFEFRWPKPQK